MFRFVVSFMRSSAAFMLSTLQRIWLFMERNVIRPGPATWITSIARVQAEFQASSRPAVWCPFIRNPHCHEEKWIMPSQSGQSNMEDILRGLMTVIQSDTRRSFWEVKKADPTFIQVRVFTRFEWLDVIELTIHGSSVKVWSFSTGVLPLCIPCVCFINLFFFWIPFWDFRQNKRRVSKIVEAMDMGIQRL